MVIYNFQVIKDDLKYFRDGGYTEDHGEKN